MLTGNNALVYNHILSKCDQNLTTEYIFSTEFYELGLLDNSLKTSLKRLIQAGYLKVNSSGTGRNNSYRKFTVLKKIDVPNPPQSNLHVDGQNFEVLNQKHIKLYELLQSLKDSENNFKINWTQCAKQLKESTRSVQYSKEILEKYGYITPISTKNGGRGVLHLFHISIDREKDFFKSSEKKEKQIESQVTKRKKEQGYIYLIKCLDKVKIGWSELSPANRLKALQTGNPEELVLLHSIKGNEKAERVLHKQFAHLHYRGEWFKESQEIVDLFTSKDFQFLIENLTL